MCLHTSCRTFYKDFRLTRPNDSSAISQDCPVRLLKARYRRLSLSLAQAVPFRLLSQSRLKPSWHFSRFSRGQAHSARCRIGQPPTYCPTSQSEALYTALPSTRPCLPRNREFPQHCPRQGSEGRRRPLSRSLTSRQPRYIPSLCRLLPRFRRWNPAQFSDQAVHFRKNP